MNQVLSASRLMKAAEVKEICREMRKNRAMLLAVEVEAKRRLFSQKEKAAS
ncbi:hypothetical protein [Mesobacillus zeae]|uniref:hypothetical protein n=1 Tax=Mesobacillus zeae TaxID=1917180 RepID=UPI0015E79514|nr:hypothetical protein [Mesobacillus zeae]